MHSRRHHLDNSYIAYILRPSGGEHPRSPATACAWWRGASGHPLAGSRGISVHLLTLYPTRRAASN